MTAKILFVLHDTTQSRHFFTLFEELIARGCDIHLRVFHFGEKELKLPTYLRHIPQLRIAPLKIRPDIWGKYARAFRGTRNYFLYGHTSFPDCSAFRDRAWDWTDPLLRKLLRKHGRSPAWCEKLLKSVEDAIPPDADICREIIDGGFDLVIVSPYIFYQNTFHNDYVKAAHAVGKPVGFPVFSWDNLTTKGNVQILPDRIWVWNETQRRELVELHDVPDETVCVTGAYRFDDYRKRKPTHARDEFCGLFALNPEQPIIAYLGSSPAVAPDEGAFVGRWLSALRDCGDARISKANVVVRSHPRNLKAWNSLDGVLKHDNVAFQEPVASDFWNTQALFDLLTHADAVVGINTSGMLEGSIHGVPVHSILEPSMSGGQEGAVHFNYLTTAGGGLLYLDENIAAHLVTLSRTVSAKVRPDPRAEAFFKAFIDDGEDARTPTVRAADDIVALARIKKTPARRRLRDKIANGVYSSLLEWRLLRVAADPDYEKAHGRKNGAGS